MTLFVQCVEILSECLSIDFCTRLCSNCSSVLNSIKFILVMDSLISEYHTERQQAQVQCVGLSKS